MSASSSGVLKTAPDKSFDATNAMSTSCKGRFSNASSIESPQLNRRKKACGSDAVFRRIEAQMMGISDEL